MCDYCGDLIIWMGYGNFIPLREARRGGCCNFYIQEVTNYYSNLGEGTRRDNRHGERKTRRVRQIRSLWQFPDTDRSEELVSQIHTCWYGQQSIQHEITRNQRKYTHRKTGRNTTQVRLTTKY